MSTSKLQSTLDNHSQNLTPEDEKRIRLKFPQKHRRLRQSQPFIRKMLHQLKLFYQMVFDRRFHFTGKNRYIMLGALLYFMIPFDLLSDFIPVLGYIDDAMIVKLAWKSAKQEIDNYHKFLETTST